MDSNFEHKVMEIHEFDEFILDELEKNPVWQFLLMELDNRIKFNREHLEYGDIGRHNEDEKGNYIYRSDEALRGGILEIIYVLNFMESFREEVKEAREIHQRKEQEIEDGRARPTKSELT